MNLGSAQLTVKIDARQLDTGLKQSEATTEAFSAQASNKLKRVQKDMEALGKSAGLTGAEMKQLEDRAKSGFAAESAAKALERIARAANLSTAELSQLGGRMGFVQKNMGTTHPVAAKMAGAIEAATSAASLLTIAGVGAAAAIFKIGESSLQAGINAQNLTRTFAAITGSALSARRELDFVRETANRAGIDFNAAAEGYKGIAAAAKGTTLAGKDVRDIFVSVSTAAANLSLGADRTRFALLAIQQMMSKGKVTAEDFRQQLAEHIPLALEAAALATGKTRAEFVEMLEKGMIIPDQFLPKFAEKLKELSGKPMDGYAQASARAGNETTRFKENLASLLGLTDAATVGMNRLGRIMRDLANDAEGIKFLFEGRMTGTQALFLGGGDNLDAFLKYAKSAEGVAEHIAKLQEKQGKFNPLTSPYERSRVEAEIKKYQDLLKQMEDDSRQEAFKLAQAKADKMREQRPLLGGVTTAQRADIDEARIESAKKAQEEAERFSKKATAEAKRAREALEAMLDKAASYRSSSPEDSAIRQLEKELRDLTERAKDAGIAVPAALQEVYATQIRIQEKLKGYKQSGLFSADAQNAYDETAKRMGTGGFKVDDQWKEAAQKTMERLETEKEVSRKIFELSASERDVQLNNLAIQVDAYKKAGVDKALVDQLWAAEAKKYSDDYLDGALRGIQDYTDTFKSGYEGMRASMSTFLQSAEDAWVSWVTTGEFSVRQLVGTMISEFARLTYQKGMGQILSMAASWAITAAGAYFGGGGSTGAPGTAQGSGPISHQNDAAAWMDWGSVNTGYADGGVSYGPQLAWVSEGRYAAEAHVPLPNGRSIPVELSGGGKGGGDTYNFNVSVDASGNTSSSADSDQSNHAQLAGMIGVAVRGIIQDEQRPGGLLNPM